MDQRRASLVSGSIPSTFPRQGQIDWTALSKSTIGFTVDTISRLSKAGVEALTIYAATAMFRQSNIGELGEQRVLEALQLSRAFASYNNALWFGFGVKHLARSLAESREGVFCEESALALPKSTVLLLPQKSYGNCSIYLVLLSTCVPPLANGTCL